MAILKVIRIVNMNKNNKNWRYGMNKFIKQLILLAIFVIGTGLGASLVITASLGIGAYDAAAMSISKVLTTKVGNISMIINVMCIVFQLIILKKAFKPLQFLQVGVAVLLGNVVNFFLYDVFAELIITNYILKLSILLLGCVVCAFSVAMIMAINIVSMPLEGFCMALSNKYNMNFGKVRQYADIISIVIVVILTLSFGLELTLREGTIIGMIIFGPMLDRFMNISKPALVKYNLI